MRGKIFIEGGISVGSRVRLMRKVQDFPAGFIGTVISVTDRMVEIKSESSSIIAPLDAVSEVSFATSSAEELANAFGSPSTNHWSSLPHTQVDYVRNIRFEQQELQKVIL